MRSLSTNTRETCTVSDQDFSFFFKFLCYYNESFILFFSMKTINSYFILKQQSMLVIVHLLYFFFPEMTTYLGVANHSIFITCIWECVTLSRYKTPFVCVLVWPSVNPFMSVFVVYSCFYPRVYVWVWRWSTCGGNVACGCALAQHTFWWMLPLYGISVMFRQCDIAVCFRPERWW